MTVSGGVWSIVHVWTAGDGSTLPAPSFARTRKVCEVAARPERFRGLVHAVHDEVSGTSTWHSKVRLPAGVVSSVPVKVNVAEVLEVAGSGLPVSWVSGTPSGGAPVPNFTTSCGRLVLSERLWNCCSASWFSVASRTRNPLLAPVYMAWTRPATFHSR